MAAIVQRATRSLLLLALFSAQALAQAGVARQPATTPLPRTLTNTQFWAMISEFSEPGGVFPSDNYTSNELMIGQVATELIERGKTGGAYLGVGPEQNFTYIAATKPDIVFIVDIRRQAVMQHLMYKALFELSANRGEFIARLFSKPVQALSPQDTSMRDIWMKYLTVPSDTALYSRNIAAIHGHLAKTRGFALTSSDSSTIELVYDTFYRYGPLISYSARAGVSAPARVSATGATFLSLTLVTDTLGVPRSFLANESNFQFIKGLHSRNMFIPIVGNFGGPQALRMVGDYLRQHRTVLASYYPSNVEQYLFRPPVAGPPLWQEYYNTVGLMPLDSNSVWIRSNALRVNQAQVLTAMQDLPLQTLGVVAGSPTINYSTSTMRVILPTVPPVPPTPVQSPVTQSPNLGSITGTVVDGATGAPLGSTAITITGTTIGTMTDSTGQFIIPNINPGIYTLGARRIGYAPITLSDLRAVAGTPTVVDMRAISQPVNLSGVITTGGGTFVVSSMGSSATNMLSGVTLCPVIPFLAAYTAGRVQSYNDATRCVR